jgi:hypothetical protein
MKNTLILGTFLLGCCLVAVGQTSSSSSTSDQSPGYSSQTGSSQGSSGAGSAGQAAVPSEQQGAMSANEGMQAGSKTSIRGCLSKAADGSYQLTAFNGNTYQLSGDTAQLGMHVGHEVRLDGVQSSATAPGAMSASPSGQAQQQFSVSKVHHVANTCRATGGGSSTGGSSGTSGGGY